MVMGMMTYQPTRSRLPEAPEPLSLRERAQGSGLRLPSYLWSRCGWRQELRPVGGTWRQFRALVSREGPAIRAWREGGLWEALESRLRYKAQVSLGK